MRKSAGFCLARIIGRMDASEYEPAMTTLLDHPDMLPGMPVVYDQRAADMTQLDANAFKHFAIVNQRLAARRGRALVAIVVPDDAHFGLARMYEVLVASPNLKVQVYRDFAGALEWVQRVAAERGDGPPPG